jgi:hypothetical protein
MGDTLHTLCPYFCFLFCFFVFVFVFFFFFEEKCMLMFVFKFLVDLNFIGKLKILNT